MNKNDRLLDEQYNKFVKVVKAHGCRSEEVKRYLQKRKNWKEFLQLADLYIWMVEFQKEIE